MKNSILKLLLVGGGGITGYVEDSVIYREEQRKTDEILDKLTANLSKEERYGFICDINAHQGRKEIEIADLYFKEGIKTVLKLLFETFTE